MNADAELALLAADQHGVFSVRDADRLGVPPRTIRRHSGSGRYERLYPGVYAVAGSVDTPLRRMVAAAKSFPAIAAISHQTAAELWGMGSSRAIGFEVVTTRWDRSHRPGLVVHESLDLIADDIVIVDGIPVTTAARTVVDLGASNRWMVESALEQGIRLNHFTLDDVEAFIARVARRGRRGVGVIRPLVAARRRWDSVTESVLEDKFRKLLADAGLPDAATQFVVTDDQGLFVARVDFAYPAARVLIELDSEAHHMDRLAFRHDRSKQNRASVLGWTVLRYTWWDIVERPTGVVTEIDRAISVLA
ncbi:MAG: type IV toxin-antitoxin system AbiEi family antitoxin domain-containing protein [Acidimicrobiia bacterium]|nr:type IV toxin-antitoxin system AbiEi family antitoxin domain-containing protein [Acidimicrobiia bacterium]